MTTFLVEMTGSQAVSRFKANPQLTNNSLHTQLPSRFKDGPHYLICYKCFTVDYTLFYTSSYILSSYHSLCNTLIPASTSSLISIISHIVRVLCACLYISVARYCFFANMQIYSSLCFILLVYTCRSFFTRARKRCDGEVQKTLRGASPEHCKHCKHDNSPLKNTARKIKLLGWERKSAQSKIKLGLFGANPEW